MRRLLDIIRQQADLATVAGWSFLAAVIARSANLLAMVICARILSREQFGEIAIIQSTVGMFGPIAGLGLSMTTTKFLAEYRDSDRERASRILGLSFSAAVVAGALMTGALIVLAPWLATTGLASPGLRKPLIEASGLLLLGVVEGVEIGALTGLEAFSRIARVSAWNAVLTVPVVAFLAHRNGAPGAIAGLTIALAWSCVLNGIILRGECRKRGVRFTASGWTSEWRVLSHFSLPSYLSGIFIAPVTWITSALLVKQPGGLAEMGLYSAADRFRFLLIFVPLSVSRIAVPALTRFRAAGDHGGYRDAFYWNVGFGILTTAPPALLCALLARPLMSWFGKSFAQGWPVLAILAISAVPAVLNTQLGAALLSADRAWARSGTDAVLATLFLLGAWWMIPVWKAAGLALAFAIAYTGASVTLWLCLRHSPRQEVQIKAPEPAREFVEVSLEKSC